MTPSLTLITKAAALAAAAVGVPSLANAAKGGAPNRGKVGSNADTIHANAARTATARAGQHRLPNILLLLTDDQDLLLGGLNHMPKLRRHLIEGGTYFRNGFVHTPICCPSRSSILTGRYLHNGGALNNSFAGNCYGERWRGADTEGRTFAVHAKEAGYKTSYAGKYLNRYGLLEGEGEKNAVPPGWDRWLGLVGNSVYYNYEVVQSEDGGKTAERIKHGKSYETDYLPDVVANRTLAVLDDFLADDGTDDRPFLAVVAWPTPHGPFTPAPWADHVYDGYSAPRTPNWNASASSNRNKHWLMRRLGPIDPPTERFIDETYRLRLEALMSVDEHVNQFVELFRRRGALDNTIILYTSDNGYQLGQHRLEMDKRQMYEYDVRVPFLASGPSVPRNVTSNRIVMNVDIAPTIYELVTGASTSPPDMDGISFAPYLTGRGDNERTAARRVDFLISYHGEGNPACGMATCPPVPAGKWHGGYMPDAYNNTFHCVRTIVPSSEAEAMASASAAAASALLASPTSVRRASAKGGDGTTNTVYCRFVDDENFVEYYDLTDDEWELTNRRDELSQEERDAFEERLEELRRCKGDGCRTLPPLRHGVAHTGEVREAESLTTENWARGVRKTLPSS